MAVSTKNRGKKTQIIPFLIGLFHYYKPSILGGVYPYFWISTQIHETNKFQGFGGSIDFLGNCYCHERLVVAVFANYWIRRFGSALPRGEGPLWPYGRLSLVATFFARKEWVPNKRNAKHLNFSWMEMMKHLSFHAIIWSHVNETTILR